MGCGPIEVTFVPPPAGTRSLNAAVDVRRRRPLAADPAPRLVRLGLGARRVRRAGQRGQRHVGRPRDDQRGTSRRAAAGDGRPAVGGARCSS